MEAKTRSHWGARRSSSGPWPPKPPHDRTLRPAQVVMGMQTALIAAGGLFLLLTIFGPSRRGAHAIGALLAAALAVALGMSAAHLPRSPWAWGTAMALEGLLVVDSLLRLSARGPAAIVELVTAVVVAALLALSDSPQASTI